MDATCRSWSGGSASTLPCHVAKDVVGAKRKRHVCRFRQPVLAVDACASHNNARKDAWNGNKCVQDLGVVVDGRCAA